MFFGPKGAELERIMAIAEYFIDLKNKSSIETRLLRHSTEYYMLMNDLVKQGYMKVRTPKKDDPLDMWYLINKSYWEVEEIAEEIGIRLIEYIKPDIMH